MRVLIAAYACLPDASSEPGAGWEWACAAARRHEVWLVTGDHCAEATAAAVTERGIDGIRVVSLDRPRRPGSDQIRSIVWHRRLRSLAVDLHAEHRFDVAHHLTLATDWLPSGLAALDGVPLVWGPVGGVPGMPLPLWRSLEARDLPGEAVRSVVTAVGRRCFGRPLARRAALTVVQGPSGIDAFAGIDVEVESNAAIAPADLAAAHRLAATGPMPPATDRRRAVFVGRLLPWKGLHLAVEALTRDDAADWDLDVFGAGDLDRFRSLVDAHGLGGRVRVRGHLERIELLAEVATADALLLPSMHDAGPWTVAEAVSLGCPVVALRHGGPAYLVGPGEGVLVEPRGDMAGALAAALARVERPVEPSRRWLNERLPDIVDDWYRRAAAR